MWVICLEGCPRELFFFTKLVTLYHLCTLYALLKYVVYYFFCWRKMCEDTAHI